jgi:hypothetical protein
MSGRPGGGLWWLVNLRDDHRPGHDLVCAPNRRQALAAFRADVIIFFSAHESKRWAAARVRALGPVITGGPLTPQQAFDHALGWMWAREITRREETTVMLEPAGPASREEAERLLGPELAGRIERNVAAPYLRSLPPPGRLPPAAPGPRSPRPGKHALPGTSPALPGAREALAGVIAASRQAGQQRLEAVQLAGTRGPRGISGRPLPAG